MDIDKLQIKEKGIGVTSSHLNKTDIIYIIIAGLSLSLWLHMI